MTTSESRSSPGLGRIQWCLNIKLTVILSEWLLVQMNHDTSEIMERAHAGDCPPASRSRHCAWVTWVRRQTHLSSKLSSQSLTSPFALHRAVIGIAVNCCVPNRKRSRRRQVTVLHVRVHSMTSVAGTVFYKPRSTTSVMMQYSV